jgi:hypothetical protein
MDVEQPALELITTFLGPSINCPPKAHGAILVIHDRGKAPAAKGVY